MDNGNHISRQKIRLSWIVVMAFISFVISLGIIKFVSSGTLTTVTIEVMDDCNPNAIPNHEVRIEKVSIDGEEDLYTVFLNAKESTGFEFRKASDYGYNNDVIVNTGGAGSRLQFECLADQSHYFTFWKQNFSGMVHIQRIKDEEIVDDYILDLYSNEEDQKDTFFLPQIGQPTIIQYFVCVFITSIILSTFGVAIYVIILKTKKKALVTYICAAGLSLIICSCLYPVIISFVNTIPLSKLKGGMIGKFTTELTYNTLKFMGIETTDNANVIIIFLIYIILFLIVFYCLFRINIPEKIQNKGMIEERDKAKGQRSIGIDLLKSTGAIFVMAIHGYFNLGYYERSPHSVDMIGLSAIYCILLSCVPIFIVSTGYLMSKKQYSVKYFINWFKYLIIYFVIVFIQQIVMKIKYGADISIQSLLRSFSIYENGYMSMFFGLYLLVPALNMIYAACNSKKKRIYLISGLLFLTIGQSILGNMFTRYWICLAPICYYFTGAFLHNYKIKLTPWKGIGLIILIVCFETIYIQFTSHAIIDRGFFWKAYTNYENTYYIFPTYLITLLISILLTNITSATGIWRKIIQKISTHTLEIYLVHSLLLSGYSWEILSNLLGNKLTPQFRIIIFPGVLIIEFVVTLAVCIPVHLGCTFIYNKLLVFKGRLTNISVTPEMKKDITS